MSVTGTTAAPRTSALIALGALAVHQLRYLAGYGEGAGAALAFQGHGYLETLLPVVVVLAASSVLGTLVAATFRAPPRGAGWTFCTVALLVIFVVQESVEGMLSPGHPGGLGAVLGHGGWVAAPIAVLVGRVVSLLISGLRSAEQALRRASDRPVRRGPATLGRAPSPETRPRASRALAFGFARRPPPLSTG